MNTDTYQINVEKQEISEKTPIVPHDVPDPETTLTKEKHEEVRSGNIPGAVFNLANGLIGAGTLSFPYMFSQTGLITGIGIVAIIVILTMITLEICAKTSYMLGGVRSYQKCLEAHLGIFWRRVCEIILVFYATGILTTYFVVIGQFIKPVVDLFAGNQEYFWNDHRFIIVVFAVVLIYPLILIRQIKELGFTSLLALFCALYLTVFVTVIGIIKISTGNMGPGQIEKLWVQTDNYPNSRYPLVFLAAPIINFGYVCHELTFPITYEIKKGSFKKATIVIFASEAVVTLVYLLNGFFGWFAFGTDVEDNILNNFPGSNVFANIGRFAIGLNITFSFPVQSYAVRLALTTLLFGKSRELPLFWHVLIITVYFFINLTIALFVPAISVCFGFVGSLLASVLMFFFPALLSWKVLAKEYPKYKWFFYILAVVLVLVCVFFQITGCTASVFRLIEVVSPPKK